MCVRLSRFDRFLAILIFQHGRTQIVQDKIWLKEVGYFPTSPWAHFVPRCVTINTVTYRKKKKRSHADWLTSFNVVNFTDTWWWAVHCVEEVTGAGLTLDELLSAAPWSTPTSLQSMSWCNCGALLASSSPARGELCLCLKCLFEQASVCSHTTFFSTSFTFLVKD